MNNFLTNLLLLQKSPKTIPKANPSNENSNTKKIGFRTYKKIEKNSPKKKLNVSESSNSLNLSQKNISDNEEDKIIQENTQDFHENHLIIKEMLSFLVENVGKINQNKLESFCDKFTNKGKIILETYSTLLKKYKISSKTKEEKIKFVLRKAFKYMKEQIVAEEKLKSNKFIDQRFLQIYFQDDENKNAEEKSQLKDLLMPFRKKSVNKTMNQQFLSKIFGFKKFAFDFLNFLSKF